MRNPSQGGWEEKVCDGGQSGGWHTPHNIRQEGGMEDFAKNTKDKQ